MIVAFVETLDGVLKDVAFETVSVAHRVKEALGGEVVAVGVGKKAEGLERLGKAGANQVLFVEDERLEHAAQARAHALLKVLEGKDVRAVVFPATKPGKEVAPFVAAGLSAPMLTDIVDLTFEGEALVAKKPLYAGKVIGTFRLEHPVLLLSHRPKAFEVRDAGGEAPVDTVQVDVDPRALRVEVLEIKEKEKGEVDVAEADYIVSGGRGMGGAENFKLLYELAEALTRLTGKKVAVGASRAAVDAGWMPHSHQVGQTGKVVSPELYMAVGISGALQHLAGMRTSKVIVAINKDPEAPIFKLADFGVVDDLFKVIPELTRRLKERAGA